MQCCHSQRKFSRPRLARMMTVIQVADYSPADDSDSESNEYELSVDRLDPDSDLDLALDCINVCFSKTTCLTVDDGSKSTINHQINKSQQCTLRLAICLIFNDYGTNTCFSKTSIRWRRSVRKMVQQLHHTPLSPMHDLSQWINNLTIQEPILHIFVPVALCDKTVSLISEVVFR